MESQQCKKEGCSYVAYKEDYCKLHYESIIHGICHHQVRHKDGTYSDCRNKTKGEELFCDLHTIKTPIKKCEHVVRHRDGKIGSCTRNAIENCLYCPMHNSETKHERFDQEVRKEKIWNSYLKRQEKKKAITE